MLKFECNVAIAGYMAPHKIEIGNRQQETAIILHTIPDENGRYASIQKESLASPADEKIFQFHLLTTFSETLNRVFLIDGKTYERGEWYVSLKALLEVLDRLPPGWSYRTVPKIEKIMPPLLSGAAVISKGREWIIET